MDKVLQFKISLIDSIPEIWRRIQILDKSTFWDLHVAIQDSMGWQDCHLHQFILYDQNVKGKKAPPIYIGIPDDEGILADINIDMLADWKIKISEYLDTYKTFCYEYDFGDSWQHYIEFEGLFDKDSLVKKYPICLDGEYACPPEDVGGMPGFYQYVEVITNKKHPDYKDCFAWRGSYDPNKFDSSKVKFMNAKHRLNQLLNDV